VPSTDEQANQQVYVRKGMAVSLYHTIVRYPLNEYNVMTRQAAEALNLKPCDRCEFQ
jgi:hypothetical protein